jgi:pimeloyl-ACP methyl ester carboxylesterase
MTSESKPPPRFRSEAGFFRGMAVLGAAALTLGRSYRRYDWTTGEDERHVARTADGWNLALYRYRAIGEPKPFPVICSHGMAGSHFIYDLHSDYSLARTLAGRGFDTWLVDLRGRGSSWPDGGPAPSLQWSFDDFVARDFPAAVDRVCDLTSAKQAFWLGMEMSGQVLYAAAIDGLAGRVRGAVTCGSPVLTPRTALVPGVTSAPKTRKRGRVPFRGGSRFAGPVLAYGGFGVLESSFRKCNIVPLATARYFRNGIPDEATDLVDQFADWIREGVMRRRDGSVIYSACLADVTLPLLVVAAEHDLQRPADAVRAAFDTFGSQDKTFLRPGVAEGFSVDFGHDDLLAGLAAPTEVFPRIADWLAERSR